MYGLLICFQYVVNYSMVAEPTQHMCTYSSSIHFRSCREWTGKAWICNSRNPILGTVSSIQTGGVKFPTRNGSGVVVAAVLTATRVVLVTAAAVTAAVTAKRRGRGYCLEWGALFLLATARYIEVNQEGLTNTNSNSGLSGSSCSGNCSRHSSKASQ